MATECTPARLARRGAAPILLAMSAGTISTVLVAWGCLLACPDRRWFTPGQHLGFAGSWAAPVPDRWSDEDILAISWTYFGATEILLLGSPVNEGESYRGPAAQQLVVSVGWPMRSLRCERTDCADPPLWTGGVPNPLRTYAADPEKPVLPVRVIPGGFLIDASIAAVLFAAVPLLLAMRRERRRRQLRCQTCGHQLTSSQTICSECGVPVTSPVCAPEA